MEDILIDSDGNFVAAVDGDVETVSGMECLIQDENHRLDTWPGDLWLHLLYGSKLRKFIQSLDDDMNRLELEQEIRLTLKQDEKIDPESIKITIKSWERDSKKIKVSFYPVDGYNDDEVSTASTDILIILGAGTMEVLNL